MTSTAGRGAVLTALGAALVPKCPLCIGAALGSLGMDGLQRPLGAHGAEALLALDVAFLVATIALFSRRHGVAGGIVSTIAALLIACGRHVWANGSVAAGGIALLVGYALAARHMRRRGCCASD